MKHDILKNYFGLRSELEELQFRMKAAEEELIIWLLQEGMHEFIRIDKNRLHKAFHHVAQEAYEDRMKR